MKMRARICKNFHYKPSATCAVYMKTVCVWTFSDSLLFNLFCLQLFPTVIATNKSQTLKNEKMSVEKKKSCNHFYWSKT